MERPVILGLGCWQSLPSRPAAGKCPLCPVRPQREPGMRNLEEDGARAEIAGDTLPTPLPGGASSEPISR